MVIAISRRATTMATPVAAVNNVVIQTATAIKEETEITVAAITTVEMAETTTKINIVTTMDTTGIGEGVKILMVKEVAAVYLLETTVATEVTKTRLDTMAIVTVQVEMIVIPGQVDSKAARNYRRGKSRAEYNNRPDQSLGDARNSNMYQKNNRSRNFGQPSHQ